MTLKSRIKRKSGIEPLVAAILLIAISIIAAVMIYLWLSGYVTGTASKAEKYSRYEAIAIDAIGISGTGGTYDVTMYVRNVGEVPVTITAAYILTVNGTVVNATTGLNVAISPGGVGEVSLTNVTLTPGETYLARVVTASGVKAEAWFTAPSS